MKRLATVLLTATIIGCASPSDEIAPAAQTSAARAAANEDSIARLEPTPPPALITRSRRDPFAYVTHPQPAARVATIAATPPPVVIAQLPAPQLEPVPSAPQFPYRYIGRFGPAHDPIAAFARPGEVKTVRAGERIDDEFVLRAINLETVQVEARGWAARIVIGLSADS